jgi:hypothetical protein
MLIVICSNLLKNIFITKTRNLERAAQALSQRRRSRSASAYAACAPREHEIYIFCDGGVLEILILERVSEIVFKN